MQLWVACTDGDLALVQSLVAAKSPPPLSRSMLNFVGPEREDTPLHRACRFGHAQVVEYLLTVPGVALNQGNAGDASPFNIACQEGHVGVLQVLLRDPRIEVNKLTRDQQTPFYAACREGRAEAVRVLLEDERISTLQTNAGGYSPFAVAASNGFVFLCQLILCSGRDVNLGQMTNPGPAFWNNQTVLQLLNTSTTRERFVYETVEDYERERTNAPSIVAFDN